MINFYQARENMVNGQIETAGVTNLALLDSFGAVPREEFVPEAIQSISYRDEDIDIGHGRYLMSPIVHAKLLQAAQPQSHEVVLDVGCGSGYSSAILSPLVSTVVALDKDEDLLGEAGQCWKALGLCNIASLKGDLRKGAPDGAPFDLIIVNGAVSEIPQILVDQLSDTGRLMTVLKLSGRVMGQAVMVRKNSDGAPSVVPLFDASASYLPEFMPSVTFRF